MFCSKCGSQIKEGATFCGMCGTPVANPNFIKPDLMATSYQNPSNYNNVEYASLMNRTLAQMVDGLILTAMIFVIMTVAMMIATPMLMEANAAGSLNIVAITFIILLIMAMIPTLYYAKTESGEHQASFGKRALGIKIMNEDGSRISFSKSIWRMFLQGLFSIFFITYIYALFNDKHQTLHDLLTHTVVVNK